MQHDVFFWRENKIALTCVGNRDRESPSQNDLSNTFNVILLVKLINLFATNAFRQFRKKKKQQTYIHSKPNEPAFKSENGNIIMVINNN